MALDMDAVTEDAVSNVAVNGSLADGDPDEVIKESRQVTRATARPGDRRARMYYQEECEDEFGDPTLGPKIWTGGVLHLSIVQEYEWTNTDLFVADGNLMTIKAPPLASINLAPPATPNWYDIDVDYFAELADESYEYPLSDLMDHELVWYPKRCRAFLANGAARRPHRRAGKKRNKKK